jgi:predicted regulator of Ras-like GTPase activity (Roadblock/LC7/MglB family)
MDLTELLTGAVARVPGAVAISLLGVDGVAVETINSVTPAADGAQAGPHATDAWEVELADLMRDARRATQSLDWGRLRHVTLETRRLALVARMISADYFVLLVLQPTGRLGRARVELRRVARTIADGL